MKKLAIIPARGDSKRIPRKNIKDFNGKPIISYSIDTALKSELFDEVMVTTDNHEIAEIARNFGASIPFMRSAKNADDHATTSDVIIEVLNNYLKEGRSFDLVCCIYPTAPLLSIEKIKESFELIQEKKYDSVFPVVPFPFPIQRAVKKDDNGKMSMFQPEHKNTRSQDLEPAYHDAGQFYTFWAKTFLEKKEIWTDNTGLIALNELEVQDIDNIYDWKLAELKYQLKSLKKNID